MVSHMSTLNFVSYARRRLFEIQDYSLQRIFVAYQEGERVEVHVSPLCRRYREVRAIQARLDGGESLEAIAQERCITRPALNRHMALLKLPEEQQRLINRDDPSIHNWPIRDAIKAGSDHERWLLLVQTLDTAERWAELIESGVSQTEIGRREGITRARVCQLIRLSGLDQDVKAQIRDRDDAYYGKSLRQVWMQIERG